ncbi:MAG: LPS export ABC transporter permease LptG, partial [Pseudomonadales bacterium]|nr:LPS export ABC transporter permease LptG [Pseudomonadales bacterium]
MRKLDRYIVKSVASAMLMVLMVVISLDLVFSFIAELEDLRENYQTLQALMYVVTTLPRRIYDYLPLAAFIGSLIGLGMLANSSELVVVRAAGISVTRIVWSAMKPAVAVVVIGLLLGEFIAPYTERIAQSEKAVAIGGEDRVGTSYGIWHREQDTFMYFNAVEPHGVLHGVTLYEFDTENWLERVTYSKRAIYQGDHWLMEDVEHTALSKESTSKVVLKTERWDTRLSPDVLGVLIVKPDNLSITGLYTYARYLLEQGLNANNYLMSFWKKVLRPLTTAALVLVAIS